MDKKVIICISTLMFLSFIATPAIIETINAAGSNRPPVPDANGPYTENEGSLITFDASGTYDPDNDPLEYRWDFDNDGTWDSSWTSSPYETYTWCDNRIGTVKVEVTDGMHWVTDTSTVTVYNVAPTADFGNDGPVDEGSLVTVSFSNEYDPGCDTFVYSFDWENNGVYDVVDQSSSFASHTWCDDGVYTVKGMIKDDDGGYNEYTTDVTVYNVAPTVNAGPDVLIPLGQPFFGS